MSRIEKGFYIRLAVLIVLILVHLGTDSGKNFSDGLQRVSLGYYLIMAYFMYFCFLRSHTKV